MSDAKIFPDYVEASSPKGLQRLLLRVYNALHASNMDIQQFTQYTDKNGKIKFGCWYYVVLDNDLIERVVDDGR